jgi:hypothetical protein
MTRKLPGSTLSEDQVVFFYEVYNTAVEVDGVSGRNWYRNMLVRHHIEKLRFLPKQTTKGMRAALGKSELEVGIVL